MHHFFFINKINKRSLSLVSMKYCNLPWTNKSAKYIWINTFTKINGLGDASIICTVYKYIIDSIPIYTYCTWWTVLYGWYICIHLFFHILQDQQRPWLLYTDRLSVVKALHVLGQEVACVPVVDPVWGTTCRHSHHTSESNTLWTSWNSRIPRC